jgi:protein-S-isoprenylcysteine O-methyltransferase Ste14
MRHVVYDYIEWTWVAVGIVWLIAAFASKRTARREAAGSRLLHLAIMTATFVLLFPSLPFAGGLPMGALARRFVPDWPLIAWTGLALTVTGCAFAVWARLLLGSNWSSSVTVKQDHQLIRKGPYAIVRHPIYSGFLLGLLGAALGEGEWRGIAGLALAFIGWAMKSRKEEAFMTAQFGAVYSNYQGEVKALIPFVL